MCCAARAIALLLPKCTIVRFVQSITGSCRAIHGMAKTMLNLSSKSSTICS
ncbi:hypothetical protein PF008_g13699 [Phytophthora fragariae]|uniref:Uncharacterized protein n=1 Tax=Phytophthora fragariae TaxID=53985 RepID=A0A6G0RKL0_9STRA|nr:hypothetical protein PF008_g13699 [Phytophthora fragariae]